MSKVTDIQWCDSTINPIMGCGGCELFPSPATITKQIDEAVLVTGSKIDSKRIFQSLVNEAFERLGEGASHPQKRVVNTTNIWHLKELFESKVATDFGKAAASAAKTVIRQAVTCYAGILHLNRGASILNPDYEPKKGYAPIFETVTPFEGRVSDAAKWSDLLGTRNPNSSWKDDLPRMIFVSDMGDALTATRDFPFLKRDVLPAFQSDQGKRHLWLWPTKRPGNMAKLSEQIGGFPPNICAMTTLTGADKDSLDRLHELKGVKAAIRGLSIEPLWERIPTKNLNLKGIDWVIVGGESGSGKLTRPFALEWAEELRDHCRKSGVAFFLKQLGRNPTREGELLRLRDRHGGNWNEWDESLRTREFPEAFHQYRRAELRSTNTLRPIKKRLNAEELIPDEASFTAEEKADFKRLDSQVRKGFSAFIEAGKALVAIQERRLWRAGGYSTWEDYCREVAGLSKSYAHRIIQATKIAIELGEELPNGNSGSPLMPKSESQVRSLRLLNESAKRSEAWIRSVEKAGGKQPTAKEVTVVVMEILEPEQAAASPPTRSERRAEIVQKLRMTIQKRDSWDEVESLLSELEGLI